MDEFDIEAFIADPTVLVLDSLKKADLLAIAQHYKLPTNTTQKKGDVKKLIRQYLIDEELVPEEEGEPIVSATAMLELKRLEFQEKEKERESQVRLKELEIREKELSVQLRLRELERERESPTPTPVRTVSTFDVSKHIKFVPPFQEKEVDKYFLHFEKIATSLEWPQDSWMLLLQSVLIGKAREVYSAYELVPEAYRQNFRNYKKGEKQTYTEFAREKEALFDRWCSSKEVAKEFEKLRQLVLIEEFKACVPVNIKTYIDEQKAITLQQAAVLADDYSLTHRGVFYPSDVGVGSFTGSKDRSSSTSLNHPPRSNSANPRNQNDQRPSGRSRSVICNYCHRKGHVMAECWSLQKKKTDAVIYMVKQPDSLSSQSNQRVPVSMPESTYLPFISKGLVSLTEDGETVPIKILRDTGATQSLVVQDILPFCKQGSMGASVLVQGIELGVVKVPLHRVFLKSDLVSGFVTVGLRPTLPFEGIDFILGNDLAGSKVNVQPELQVMDEPEPEPQGLADGEISMFPACVVTRAAARRARDSREMEELNGAAGRKGNQDDGAATLRPNDGISRESSVDTGEVSGSSSLSRTQLMADQKNDSELCQLAENAASVDEASSMATCYYDDSGILMRKWRPSTAPANEEWQVVHQIVIPKLHRKEILHLAHASPTAGHMGINKTYQRILNHFYWPGLKKDVTQFCKSCHVCQMVGKPNQTIPAAPLQPIPICGEPFSHVLIDCVGPLPKTKSGNCYLLTIMCKFTRFPEAVPLRNIKASKIVSSLVKFFTFVGLPLSIQSDQGSNFMSGLMQQVMYTLGVQQYKSSAYHPESQGAIERFHQTLKNMMRAYCYEYQNEWDQGIHLLLFAIRETLQDSLGFSPFELVFGWSMRGPLKLLKESWLEEEPPVNLLDQVSDLRHKLTSAWEIAQSNMKTVQDQMKTWYDKKAQKRTFKVGEKVLALLPLPRQPLQARFCGPYVVTRKVGDVNYIIHTPDRRRTERLCHVNMLKRYFEKEVAKVATMTTICPVEKGKENEDPIPVDDVNVSTSYKLRNSDVLANLKRKLNHLLEPQQQQVTSLILDFVDLFPDTPGKTSCAHHDVEVMGATPIKQHPYRVNPVKLQFLRKEIEYMLANGIIEPSNSEWSSPCVLVPKGDGSGYRFCTDFRKINAITRTDSYPIPRIEDCIDRIGVSKYVSKLDLLKGYWQVPLTDRAKEISAFVTPDGFFQYKVMPFGMKNAPATFQRMINKIISGLQGCEGYIDDVVVYANSWEDHLDRLRNLFLKLREAQLTVNLAKTELGCAYVTYLGHQVGQGQVKPLDAKVEAIVNFPTPKNRRELMRFLGMAGYYRKFCKNFSLVAEPLTRLLCKDQRFTWNMNCVGAFTKIKGLLMSAPVLVTPQFDKPFILMVDASDIGVGAVLLQEDHRSLEHPIAYFSQKFNKSQRNYCTSEKEALALIMALHHFDFYLSAAQYPIRVYTDHNPLTFLNRLRDKNQRLMRWSIIFQGYDLNIQHIAGKDNVLADALSRGF